ncbi:MAG TPA: glycosyltransferase family 2 protein [Vicinamibacterales bacterium]|nr:glycosyltransferase family 2 protein [Vicinamibacterales bacterium]
MSSPRVSVIVPLFNGRELVRDCHDALSPVLDRLEGGAEVIYVDDGSVDDTIDVLRRLQATDPRVRIVELAANFGQHAAFTAGFAHARGRYLVTLDADLQCDPADIPRLIEPLTRGYDLVSGVRIHRQDPGARRLFSRVTTSIVSRLAGVELRDIGCPLNAFTEDVARSLAPFGELRRFLKPIAVRVARRVTEVEVQHRPRPERQGSSYSATGLVRLFMDFFVNAIGDVFAWVFVIASALAALLFVGTVTLVLIGSLPGVSPALVAFGVWMFLLTIQATLLALFGLAGDYIQRIYRQSSGRPFYLVRRVHDDGAAP